MGDPRCSFLGFSDTSSGDFRKFVGKVGHVGKLDEEATIDAVHSYLGMDDATLEAIALDGLPLTSVMDRFKIEIGLYSLLHHPKVVEKLL